MQVGDKVKRRFGMSASSSPGVVQALEGPDVLVAWYGDMELIPHFAAILKGGPIGVTLAFCDPLPLEVMADRKQLTREAETVIRRAVSRANRGLMPI